MTGARRARALASALAFAVATAASLIAPSIADARPHRSWLSRASTIAVAELPPEGRATLAAIHRGGPFGSRRDGVTFANRERLLPSQPRGYYSEYTVPTPGATNRGARRIIAGRGATGDFRTSGEYYYSDDHYRSFRRILE